MKLIWTDLLIDEFSDDDLQQWLRPWSPMLGGRVAPAFMSKFGTWFLRRPDGPVEMLDVFTGEVTRVADTYEQFVAEVNDPAWQEIYLLSPLVFHLHQEGKIAGPRQCYGLTTPPAFGGPNPLNGDSVDTHSVMVLDIAVWQDLCQQMILGPKERRGT